MEKTAYDAAIPAPHQNGRAIFAWYSARRTTSPPRRTRTAPETMAMFSAAELRNGVVIGASCTTVFVHHGDSTSAASSPSVDVSGWLSMASTVSRSFAKSAAWAYRDSGSLE